jgi:hypothetical protein
LRHELPQVVLLSSGIRKAAREHSRAVNIGVEVENVQKVAAAAGDVADAFVEYFLHSLRKRRVLYKTVVVERYDYLVVIGFAPGEQESKVPGSAVAARYRGVEWAEDPPAVRPIDDSETGMTNMDAALAIIDDYESCSGVYQRGQIR